ncbi:MAG: polymerase, sigma-24 subunit, subfamily [Verrucomicrobiales bacterium]|nr:polymerase, sigma-24 subunit, subfamily [Verrucomicrobiales bacterium]
MTPDDMTLVRLFADHQSESAFVALVERHVTLVRSVAIRQTGNTHLADEIAQAVFIILARKASTLRQDTILPAWLYRTTRYATDNALKIQRRRRAREHEAYMQSTLEHGGDASPHTDDLLWKQLAPHLDDAVDKLSEPDRAAVILRYFENRPWREVAELMQMTEDAVQKRATRALAKLRALFSKRGLTLTTALIASAVSANSAQATPIGIVKTLSAVAATNGPAAPASTLSIVQATMKTMTWLKYKFAIGMAVSATAIVGVATVALAQPQPTVYSLLENPPIIASASYEQEIADTNMLAHMPAGSAKQGYTFSCDGANFLMKFHSAGMVGKYGDLYWGTIGDNLKRFDARLNKLDGVSAGIVFQADVAQGCINSLGSSGLCGAKKIDHFQWQNGHRKATFDGDDGYKHYYYAVEFVEENGRPISATLSDAKTGVACNFLTYRYDPQFCGGQFPVEIDCYSGSNADEKRKYAIIHVKSLQLSRRHLGADLLDPAKFVPITKSNYKAFFFSNNVQYWTDAEGRPQRLLTDQEQAVQVEQYQRHAVEREKFRRLNADK